MSNRPINITACLFVCFVIACVSINQKSRPELPVHDGLTAQVGCGAVNFMVTAALPQPHATAFCQAYLQKPQQTYTSTTTIAAASIPTNAPIYNGRRTVTIPDFAWVREQERSSTALLGKACGCLALPEPTKTVVITETRVASSRATRAVEYGAVSKEVTKEKWSHEVIDLPRSSMQAYKQSNASIDIRALNGGWQYVGLLESIV